MDQLHKILSDLVPKKGRSNAAVAKQLGISGQLLGQYMAGTRNPKTKFFIDWKREFGEDLLQLIEANVSQETIANEDNHSYVKKRNELKNNGDKKRIPFYDAPASGSDVTVTEMTAIHAPAGTIDVGDLLHDSEAAIRIYGNSMLPNYPPGCVVGLAMNSNVLQLPGSCR